MDTLCFSGTKALVLVGHYTHKISLDRGARQVYDSKIGRLFSRKERRHACGPIRFALSPTFESVAPTLRTRGNGTSVVEDISKTRTIFSRSNRLFWGKIHLAKLKLRVTALDNCTSRLGIRCVLLVGSRMAVLTPSPYCSCSEWPMEGSQPVS